MRREVTPNAPNAANAPDGRDGSRPSRPASARLAATVAILPWLVASVISAATMSVELTPTPDELRLDAPPSAPRRMPSAPSPPPASGRGRGGGDRGGDDLYFDVTALISV